MGQIWVKFIARSGSILGDRQQSQADAEDVDSGRNNTAELLSAIYDLQLYECELFKKGEPSRLYGNWSTSDLIQVVGDAQAREHGLLRESATSALKEFREENSAALHVADAMSAVIGGAVANGGSKARALGTWLSGKKDAPFDGLVLRMFKVGERSKKSARFQIYVHSSK